MPAAKAIAATPRRTIHLQPRAANHPSVLSIPPGLASGVPASGRPNRAWPDESPAHRQVADENSARLVGDHAVSGLHGQRPMNAVAQPRPESPRGLSSEEAAARHL